MGEHEIAKAMIANIDAGAAPAARSAAEIAALPEAALAGKSTSS
jgi:hypothetical protein